MGAGHQAMAQQGFGTQPQQAPANFAPPAQTFYTSTPLANLGEGPAPADCPMCRRRFMTVTTPQSGNTTQYVRYFCFLKYTV